MCCVYERIKLKIVSSEYSEYGIRLHNMLYSIFVASRCDWIKSRSVVVLEIPAVNNEGNANRRCYCNHHSLIQILSSMWLVFLLLLFVVGVVAYYELELFIRIYCYSLNIATIGKIINKFVNL